MTDLFLKSALEHRRTRLYGAVNVSNASARSLIAYSLGSFGIFLVSCAVFFEYARIEVVPGVVATTRATAKVFPSRPGVLKKFNVQEGDIVDIGEILATVSVDSLSDNDGHAAADGLKAVARQHSAVRLQKSISHRAIIQEKYRLGGLIKLSMQEDVNLASQASLQTQMIASAQHLFELSDRVINEGIVSRFDHEKRRQAHLQELQKLRQIEQQRTQNATQRRQYEAQLQKLFIDYEKQISENELNLAVLEQQRSKLRADVDYNVISPIRGRVTSVQSAPGRNVDPRLPLLVLIPEDAQFLVEAYAPSKAIGFVQHGLQVRLMYDAFPYQRFGSFEGTVEEVARSISVPAELDIPIKLDEASYRVRIKMPQQAINAYGTTYPLQSGMTLKVSIVLEQRSLFDRLLAPLHAVKARS